MNQQDHIEDINYERIVGFYPLMASYQQGTWICRCTGDSVGRRGCHCWTLMEAALVLSLCSLDYEQESGIAKRWFPIRDPLSLFIGRYEEEDGG